MISLELSLYTFCDQNEPKGGCNVRGVWVCVCVHARVHEWACAHKWVSEKSEQALSIIVSHTPKWNTTCDIITLTQIFKLL